MTEASVIEEPQITQQELDALVAAAEEQQQDDKKELAKALGKTDTVTVVARHRQEEPKRAEIGAQKEEVDAVIADLETQFATTGDQKIKKELEGLFEEQDRLEKELKVMPFVQQRKLEKVQKKPGIIVRLLIRAAFAALAPLNEPLEQLRRTAWKLEMEAKKVEGKQSGLLFNVPTMWSIMRSKPVDLAKRIRPFSGETHQ